MLHAYYVLKRRLQRIQTKNAEFVALLHDKFPFLLPPAATTNHLLAPLPPHQPTHPVPSSFSALSPRSVSLLSPRHAARLTASTSSIASASLSSSLFTLSTRCLKLHLFRNQPLVHPPDSAGFVYLVRSGSLSVQRRSAVALEDEERLVYREHQYAVLRGGDDVGLYELVVAMSEHLQAVARKEKRERARAKAEEEEWERIKLRGQLTREQRFLRSKKHRERDEQQRVTLLPLPPSTPTSPRPNPAHEDPLFRMRQAGVVEQRVVAREPCVLYAVPRGAVVDCLQGQLTACARMRRWMEEKERWREARWVEDERLRAEEELRRREVGGALSRLHGHGEGGGMHRFRSWQSGYVEEREREREWRERCRREEEKKKKMEEAMVALNKTSKQMMEAVDGDGRSGLGWSAVGRSREEEDAVMANLKREAEMLKEALNKRALLHMFKADHTPHASRQSTFRTVGGQAGGGEREGREDGGGEGGGRELDPVAEAEEVRGSVVLPRLRLELLPPPSPLSTATPGEVAMSEADSTFASPSASSGPSPPLSTEPSPLASNLVSPTDTASSVFAFPKSPHRPTLPPLPSSHPPAEDRSPPSTASPSSTLAAAMAASEAALLTEDSSFPLPPACLRPSTVTLAALPVPSPVLEPPPTPYIESLLLSLLSCPLPSLPLPVPVRPRRKSQSLQALPPPRPPPVHPRHAGEGRGLLRLRQRVRGEWEEEEREREEREERRRVEVRRRVKEAVRARMEAERRRREEEEASRWRREEADRQKAEAARQCFNFVNLRPLRPLQRVRASTAAPTFITQPEVQVGEGEEGEEEEGGGLGDERLQLMAEVKGEVWDGRMRMRHAAVRQRQYLNTSQGLRPPTAHA